MKKLLKTGKKTLSVIMAVMMVLTAWVWVAPTEASAAAGNYYVRVSYYCTDAYDSGNAYTGPNFTDVGAGYTIYYSGNNGTGTETYSNSTVINLTEECKSAFSTKTKVTQCSGFPTKILYYSRGGTIFSRTYGINKVEISPNGTSDWEILWAGDVCADAASTQWKATIDSSGAKANNTGTGGWEAMSTTTSNWNYPYANTITWSNTPEAMTCPKTASNSASTQSVSVTAKDQYGVQMFDPTWSVKGSNKSTGITVSPTTSSGSTTISVTSAANIAGTTNSQTGTVTATWSTPNSTGHTSTDNSKTFTINDATYTATFKNHRNANGVVQSDYTTTAQYGVTPTAPTASNYSSGDYDYKFNGWNPTVSGITADTTYTATYDNGTFVGANYTAVDNAIAAANAIKAQYGTDYELKYTLASRSALESAINAVVRGLGRTQQATVDDYAVEINEKIAALEPNKFDVIFLDKDGAILLYEKDVEYKEAVTAPIYNAAYYDSTNHYTFTGWDTTEYTSVVDDLVIQPVFTAEGHTYTTETVTSNCVTKGATKYTCSCGYSYIDGESDYGDHVWATDYTTDLEPTCTVAGSKSIHCTLCDAQKEITSIPAKNHLWSSQSVAVEATCGKIGIMAKVCDECGICEHTIIDALEHDFKETVVNPTCTAKGYTEYVCQRDNCGYSYRDNFTDVTDHTYGAWETVSDAHCEVAGVKKRVCEDCGFTELDTIDALSHDTPAWVVVVPATCEGKGYQTKTCSKCQNVIDSEEIPALTHNYVAKTVVAPTCESKGYTIEECNRDGCGVQRIVGEKSALNHAWTSTTHEADCTHSAYIEHVCENDANHNYVEYVNGSTALTHDFTGTETIVKAATCEADGEKTVKCSRCDVTTTVIIPKLGHSYGAWEVVTEATNSEDGQWKRVCANNPDHVEYVTIPKGGHNFVEDTAQYVAPKCNSKGQRVYKCDAHTDCIAAVTVELDYAQHTVAQRVTDATCTTPGSVEAYCSVCNTTFQTTETPVVPHTLDGGTATDATCTTSGYTTYTCTADGCDFSYKVYDASKPATGHVSWTETDRENATCTTDGSVSYKCDNCTETKTEILPKTGHKYVKGAVTAADCTTAGTEVYTCACGDTYTKFIEAAKGHTFGNWEVVTAATADKHGVKKGICACGEVEYELIAPIGDHVFAEKIEKAATCTTEGEKSFTCSKHENCTANYTEEIPATGHNAKLAYSAPTCTTEGSTQIICDTCSAEISELQEIPAAGHTYSVAVSDATCITDGVRTYSCACGDSYTETIPAKGHDLSTTVTDATCGVAGSVVTECSRCEHTDTTVLAAKNHNWNDGEIMEGDAATCTTTGTKTYTCTVENCGETKTETIPATGHTWGDWTVTPSTNSNPGSVSRECAICHEIESVEIPAGGHELVVDTEASEDATCTTEGTTVYKCKNHADCGITITVTVPVKQHTIVTENIEASCTKAGYSKTYCSVCSEEFNYVVIPVKAHSYEAQQEVDPTCTSSGYTSYKCATCESNYVIITSAAKGHSFTEKVSSTADCLNDGKLTLKCACGETMETDVPALGHNYVENTTAATEATCATPATKTYECSHNGCSASYTISVGEKTSDHKWSAETVVDATNTSLGYKTRTCETCGQVYFEIIPATGEHNFNIETTDKQEPTCTVDGYIVYSCSTHTGDNACSLTSKVTVPATGHKEKLDYKAATCSEAGYSKIVCEAENCTYEKDVTTIPVLGHDWVQGEVIPATCNAKGSVAYSCSRCEETKSVEIDAVATAHKLKVETVLASCEAEGSVTVTCENGCGYEDTTTLLKLQHNWSEWVKTDATNTTDGEWKRICKNNSEHVETVAIPAGGHSFDTTAPASTTDATCKEQGTATYNCTAHTNCGVTITVNTGFAEHTYNTDVVESCSVAGSVRTYCTVCDKTFASIALSKAQHKYGEGEVVAPTCTSSGYTTYTCEKCNHTYSEIGDAPVGHTIIKSESKATCTTGDTIVISCENCDFRQEVEVPALGHDYQLNGTTPASCAAAATETYKCSRCEASYTISVGNKTEDHDWSEWEVVEAASYTSLGYQIRTCKICSKLEVETIPATGDHNFNTLVSEKYPDCVNDGEKIYSCSTHPGEDGCKLTSIVTVPATGHDEAVTTTDANCENEGTVITTCSKCDYEKTETIPALGHAYGEGVVTPATCKDEGKIEYECERCTNVKTVVISTNENAHQYETVIVDSTCTSEGSVYAKCKLCGAETEKKALPMVEHSWGTPATTNATCTTDGLKTYKCANCTETKTEVISKLGHNMKAGTAVAPTCTSSGYTPYTCENTDCAHSYKVYDENQPAKGHTWGEWTTVTYATQETNGLKHRSCTVCNDATDEQIIPAMKHEMTEIENVASTCTSAGYIIYECGVEHDGVNCDFTLRVDLPVVAHTLSTTVNKATCTVPGSVETKCACGHSEETIVLDTVPHKETLSIIPADCENAGYAVTNCEVCNKEIQREEISALGHSFDDTIEENVEVTEKATCTKEGSKNVKCLRCDEVKTVEIPKLSHEFETKETVAATCTESGYIVKDCKNCDETYNEFVSDPTGHDWNDGVETTPATCTANGEITYTCTVVGCGATKTEVIAKLGHDWGDWEVTLKPTGTVAGIQSRKCQICEATENATIPALGGTTTYTVTFVVDGKTVATQTVNHNGKATAPGIGNKAPDASYHYSYIWDVDFSRVTSDLTVTAIFTPAAHTYGEWITDITPTCETEGRRYRLCTADDCGYAQYETVDKAEHAFSVVESKDPTCIDNGYKSVKCAACGYSENQTLKRLGHVLTYHEAVEPTCDTDGLTGHYSCSRCGKNYKERTGKTEIFNVVISKKYHTFLVVEGSEATCTKDGKTDYMFCTVCGYTRNPETIPATGHADSNNDNTCDKCGSTYMENGAIVCSCSCHKNGLFNELIYKILSFFWRLFGINKSCECGRVHY